MTLAPHQPSVARACHAAIHVLVLCERALDSFLATQSNGANPMWEASRNEKQRPHQRLPHDPYRSDMRFKCSQILSFRTSLSSSMQGAWIRFGKRGRC